MEFLLILAILNTTFFLGLFLFLLKSKIFTISLSNNLNTIKTASHSLNNVNSILVLLTYLLFLIIPLFWGLGFLLKSDANVVVVLFTIAWIYNWIKYTYFFPED
jgi:hypothetical protein